MSFATPAIPYFHVPVPDEDVDMQPVASQPVASQPVASQPVASQGTKHGLPSTEASSSKRAKPDNSSVPTTTPMRTLGSHTFAPPLSVLESTMGGTSIAPSTQGTQGPQSTPKSTTKAISIIPEVERDFTLTCNNPVTFKDFIKIIRTVLKEVVFTVYPTGQVKVAQVDSTHTTFISGQLSLDVKAASRCTFKVSLQSIDVVMNNVTNADTLVIYQKTETTASASTFYRRATPTPRSLTYLLSMMIATNRTNSPSRTLPTVPVPRLHPSVSAMLYSHPRV